MFGLSAGLLRLLLEGVGLGPLRLGELFVGFGLLLQGGDLGEQALGLAPRLGRLVAPPLDAVLVEFRLITLALGAFFAPGDGTLQDAVDAPLDAVVRFSISQLQ